MNWLRVVMLMCQLTRPILHVPRLSYQRKEMLARMNMVYGHLYQFLYPQSHLTWMVREIVTHLTRMCVYLPHHQIWIVEKFHLDVFAFCHQTHTGLIEIKMG